MKGKELLKEVYNIYKNSKDTEIKIDKEVKDLPISDKSKRFFSYISKINDIIVRSLSIHFKNHYLFFVTKNYENAVVDNYFVIDIYTGKVIEIPEGVKYIDIMNWMESNKPLKKEFKEFKNQKNKVQLYSRNAEMFNNSRYNVNKHSVNNTTYNLNAFQNYIVEYFSKQYQIHIYKDIDGDYKCYSFYYQPELLQKVQRFMEKYFKKSECKSFNTIYTIFDSVNKSLFEYNGYLYNLNNNLEMEKLCYSGERLHIYPYDEYIIFRKIILNQKEQIIYKAKNDIRILKKDKLIVTEGINELYFDSKIYKFNSNKNIDVSIKNIIKTKSMLVVYGLNGYCYYMIPSLNKIFEIKNEDALNKSLNQIYKKLKTVDLK